MLGLWDMYPTNQDTLFGSEGVCIGGVHCFSLSIGKFYKIEWP